MSTKKKPNTASQSLNATVCAVWRERMGFTPDDAATSLGIPLKQWEAWEAAKEAAPRMAGLAMAALAMGMDPYTE